jgi:exopolysaccharide biosynthesis protein
VAEVKESKTSKNWRQFVDEVANQASVSLVSLLRNSVVLELSEKELVIGYQNIQVFTEKKRTKIEEIAKSFFNDSIRVVFKESDDGLDDSLQVKHDNAKAKEVEEIKNVAKNDASALEVLKLFPSAEITEITILDETEEGKR